MMSDAMMKGDMEMAHHYHHNLYFESAAMIVALITVGKLLEAISKGRTTSALRNLMRLAPQTATLLREDRETEENGKTDTNEQARREKEN